MSSPQRAARRRRGQLGIGYAGRTYAERWIVIDTKVTKNGIPDRLRFHCKPSRPTVDCPTPLGHHRWEFPIREHEDEEDVQPRRGLENSQRSGHHLGERRNSAVGGLQPPRPLRRPMAGRPDFPGGDAAHAMPLARPGHVGVRDAANLCWKLAAVIRGQAGVATRLLPDRNVSHTSLKSPIALSGMGWLITEHRPVAAVRDIFARKLTRHARVVDLLQKFCWIPDARHARGFHGGTAPAVGWQLPQPWVVTPEGATERLDDALGNQWTVLHLGTEPNGASRGRTPLSPPCAQRTGLRHRRRLDP